MLRGIDSLLMPDLLHSLASMGHGDRLAIVDANFPAASCGARIHHLAGIDAGAVLRAVLSVLPLDDFVPEAAVTMQAAGDAAALPEAVTEFNDILHAHGASPAAAVERFAFYGLARATFAIIQTGESRLYGNIILTKGVIG